MSSTSQIFTTAEMINTPDFAISGKDINARWLKKKRRQPLKRWIYFNSLRELNQKRLKNDKEVAKIKKKQKKIADNLTDSKCHFCGRNVHRLTCAHVGITAAQIINKILDDNPTELDMEILDQKVRDMHNNTTIVICCDICNKRLEGVVPTTTL